MMLKACYGQMDLFIASRLHSGIFAIGAGTPTLFLGYLTKTQGITTRLGLSNYFLDINEISQSKLMERINYLNDHSADVVAEIQQALQKTKSELEIIETYLKEMRWN
jgi:polysaccharide pyruvyl transferase WcaK-like protein